MILKRKSLPQTGKARGCIYEYYINFNSCNAKDITLGEFIITEKIF
jgi:hypothetical protein